MTRKLNEKVITKDGYILGPTLANTCSATEFLTEHSVRMMAWLMAAMDYSMSFK